MAIPGKYCWRILCILARYFISWPGIHGGQPVLVRQAGAGAAQQGEHQREEKDKKEKWSVQVNGQCLVAQVSNLFSNKTNIDRIPDKQNENI